MENRKTVTLNLNAKKFLPNLLWVLKARSTDKNRYQLNYLNIDDMGYCCTDGRRLHLCKDKESLPNGLENGLYEVVIAKDLIVFQPQEGPFPEYQQIIPVDSDKKINMNIQNDSGELSVCLAKLTVKMFDGLNTVNIDFLKDLAGYTWDIYGYGQGKPVKFIDTNLLAIVMPINIKD